MQPLDTHLHLHMKITEYTNCLNLYINKAKKKEKKGRFKTKKQSSIHKYTIQVMGIEQFIYLSIFFSESEKKKKKEIHDVLNFQQLPLVTQSFDVRDQIFIHKIRKKLTFL